MKEFRLKGLSCGHCAQVLEDEIRKLEHGQDAVVSYNSGKLRVDDRVSVPALKKILAAENVSLASAQRLAVAHPQHSAQPVPACACDHDHDHKHDHSHKHEHNHGHDHADVHGHDHADVHGHDDGHAHSHDHGHDHDHSHDNNRKMMMMLVVAGVLFGSVLLLDSYMPLWLQITLYLTAIVISGYKTFMRGLRNLTRFKFTIDTLMTIALVGAVAIGEWKEATLVAVLFGLNEWLEGLGMEKARRSMESLLQVAPREATLVRDGREMVVPIETLLPGDQVKVKAGEKIPSDGTVLNGSSSVNEAAITGESMPLEKKQGDRVFGGSVNNEGLLEIVIDKAYQDSSLAKILHLVQEAQETKTPTELFINRFSKYYTPAIMIIALLVMIVPPLIGQGDWKTWLYQGLAVLIVGCPCALILASPIAIVAGITRNARNGILIKGGVHLEQLGRIDAIAFDKTGTLTKGAPHVKEAEIFVPAQFYAITAAIEQSSSHPLARAALAYTHEHAFTPVRATDIVTIPGQGMTACIDGHTYAVGNEQSVAHLQLPQNVRETIERFKADGLTLVITSDESQVLGVLGMTDEIREESSSVIAALHKQGIRSTIMLTGDHPQTAQRVASTIGVSQVYGGLLPEDKVGRLQQLKKHHKIAMIGDGINDAPALATADLGIAMGKGTDSAIETADIVLMQDHLGKLPTAVGIARQVNRIIRFNISVALGLKLLALLLTIPGWLTLWIAILSDMGATIFVTLVSLTVLIQRQRHDSDPVN